jgi:hypothetical protein
MPTHRVGPENRQDPIRLRNLLHKAEELLLENGQRTPDVRQWLEPAHRLLDDGDFWRRRRDGLALFISPNVFRRYRLPVSADELLIVTHSFHLKPLLPLLTGDGRYYILALSQHSVRLLEGTRDDLQEAPLDNVPHSLEEAAQASLPGRELQFRSAAPVGGGRWAQVFYGGGDVAEATKVRLHRYCHLIDRGLRDKLREEHAPLVLAGVGYILHLYREVSEYPHLAEAEIEGNPGHLSLEELRARAWEIVRPHFQREQAEAGARYRQFAGSPRATSNLQHIIPAAHQGRVESLFVVSGQQHWGAYDPETNAVFLHESIAPGDEDLLDRAAIQTFLKGGAVYVVPPEDMPVEGPIAAVFRY